MAQVLISGASGTIGSTLCSTLEARGHTIRRLVRQRANMRPDDIYWSVESKTIETERLEGVDVVVHLAGKPLDEKRWSPAEKTAIYRSRIDGTRLLSETVASLASRPRLFISASATDYYASNDAAVDETTGQPGAGFVSRMCQDWEEATAAAARAGIRVVNLRIPTVLSAEGHGILTTLLPLFRLGLGPVLGSGRQLMCFIARDDLARAVEHIMARDDIEGPVNVLAPETVTFRQFAKTVGELVHRPVFLRVPGLVLRLAMGEVADMVLEGDTRLVPRKLLSTGFRFEFPDLRSALRHELCQTERLLVAASRLKRNAIP